MRFFSGKCKGTSGKNLQQRGVGKHVFWMSKQLVATLTFKNTFKEI